MTFFQMSLAGGVLVAVTMIIRWISAGRLPRWTYQALWGLSLARFLIPFSIPSPVSAFTMAAKSPALSGALYAATSPALAPVAVPAQTLPAALATPAPATLAASTPALAAPVAPFPWLTVIWITGVVLALSFFVVTHLRARSIYAQSLPCRDRRVLANVMKTKSFRRVSVRVSDRIMAPLTYGVLRPVILLPQHVDEEGRDFVLAHELYHIRRFDVLWKGLLVLATCIHWFNPMAWLLLVMSSRELELSCDSAVVKNKGKQIRKDYALTLLHLEEKKALLNPLASGFNKSAIEERITQVLKIRRNPAWAMVLSIALVISCAAAFATSALPGREGALKTTGSSIAFDAPDGDAAPISTEQAYTVKMLYNVPDIDETMSKFFGDAADTLYLGYSTVDDPSVDQEKYRYSNYVDKSKENHASFNWSDCEVWLERAGTIPLKYNDDPEWADLLLPVPEEGIYTQDEALEMAKDALWEYLEIDPNILVLEKVLYDDANKQNASMYEFQFRYMINGLVLYGSHLESINPRAWVKVTDDGIRRIEATTLLEGEHTPVSIMTPEEIIKLNNLDYSPEEAQRGLTCVYHKDGIVATPTWEFRSPGFWRYNAITGEYMKTGWE